MSLSRSTQTFLLLALTCLGILAQAGAVLAAPDTNEARLTRAEAAADESLEMTEQVLAGLDVASVKIDETRIRLRRKGKDGP